MITLLPPKFPLGSLFIAIAILFVPYLYARQVDTPSPASVSQTEGLTPGTLAAENAGDRLLSGLIQKAFASSVNSVINPACLDNYQTWNSSTTRKTDAAWSTMFMEELPTDPNKLQSGNFSNVYFSFDRDINGDGLPDYMYVNHTDPSYTAPNYYNSQFDCVYLSNGQGWELAYRCVATRVGSAMTYYGNCAG